MPGLYPDLTNATGYKGEYSELFGNPNFEPKDFLPENVYVKPSAPPLSDSYSDPSAPPLSESELPPPFNPEVIDPKTEKPYPLPEPITPPKPSIVTLPKPIIPPKPPVVTLPKPIIPPKPPVVTIQEPVKKKYVVVSPPAAQQPQPVIYTPEPVNQPGDDFDYYSDKVRSIAGNVVQIALFAGLGCVTFGVVRTSLFSNTGLACLLITIGGVFDGARRIKNNWNMTKQGYFVGKVIDTTEQKLQLVGKKIDALIAQKNRLQKELEAHRKTHDSLADPNTLVSNKAARLAEVMQKIQTTCDGADAMLESLKWIRV